MTKPVRFSQVTEALTACIAAAPEAEKAALAAALEGWAESFNQAHRRGNAYRDVACGKDAAGQLLTAIEEASEARIELE